MKKKSINLTLVLIIALGTTISPIIQASEPSPKEEKQNRLLKPLVDQFKKLFNQYIKKKKEGTAPEVLRDYETRMQKLGNIAKRLGLLAAWTALIVGIIATAIKLKTLSDSDPEALVLIIPFVLPATALALAEIYFAQLKKLNKINNIVKKYGGPKLPVPMHPYDLLGPQERASVHSLILIAALDKNTVYLQSVLAEGGIYDFDEPWMWPATTELYFGEKPTAERIQQLKDLMQWSKQYDQWTKIEHKARALGIIGKNQSIKDMAFGSKDDRRYSGMTRLKLRTLVFKKVQEETLEETKKLQQEIEKIKQEALEKI